MKAPLNTSALTARIIEWNRQKGYGFLQFGKERLFLHRRDFAGPHRTPVVGDEIHFVLGHDAQGRACAKNAVHARCNSKGMVISLLVLLALLVLPVTVVQRLTGDFPWIVGGWVVLLSAITYATYARDKRSAKEGVSRVPESQLHLMELLGGWPGAFLAQRLIRHKCSKGSYQFVFWLIVIIHQVAAFDFHQNWQLSRAALNRLEVVIKDSGNRGR